MILSCGSFPFPAKPPFLRQKMWTKRRFFGHSFSPSQKANHELLPSWWNTSWIIVVEFGLLTKSQAYWEPVNFDPTWDPTVICCFFVRPVEIKEGKLVRTMIDISSTITLERHFPVYRRNLKNNRRKQKMFLAQSKLTPYDQTPILNLNVTLGMLWVWEKWDTIATNRTNRISKSLHLIVDEGTYLCQQYMMLWLWGYPLQSGPYYLWMEVQPL